MAIGNPFGYLDHSVTVGVISAKNREKIIGTQYENFLQTDAAINFGNSGGPLVDIYGRVVGINTAITSQGSGIGFAVPINMAKAVYEDFVQFGEVMRGWVGITIEDVTPERLEELGLDTTEGTLVTSVSKDDPADKAGVKVDDFIIKIDGERIRSASHLSRTVAGKEIGKAMEFILIRDGKEMAVHITPGKRPEDAIIRGGENVVDIEELGFTIRDIDDEMREELGIPDDVEGVIISNVQPRSNAAQKGLKAGIIITHIEDKEIESVEEFVKLFAKYKGGEKVIIDVLYVRNDGSTDTDVIALRIE
jgi:serine protease Do